MAKVWVSVGSGAMELTMKPAGVASMLMLPGRAGMKSPGLTHWAG